MEDGDFFRCCGGTEDEELPMMQKSGCFRYEIYRKMQCILIERENYV